MRRVYGFLSLLLPSMLSAAAPITLKVSENTGELRIAPPGQLHPIDWVLVLTAEG